jgi:hypothetical protein
MKPAIRLALFGGFFFLAAAICFGQRFRGGRGGGGWGESYLSNAETIRTAREAPSHSTGTPEWTNSLGFERDAWTFARVRYRRAPYGSWTAGNWHTDFPDSDLNLSFRLQQVTSLKVDPDGRVIDLTDKELFDYPWIYMVEPGALVFDDDEVPILRRYLLNGGFLMADDFWGERHWANFEAQIKRVLPEHEFVDLPMDHAVFNIVFPLKGPKNKLQVPNMRDGINSQSTGVTWEYHDGEECVDVHIRAILDDHKRIMVIATHNTDNGDGWEREGEDDYFFHQFSERVSYPLGINIVFYAMTH